MKEKQKLLVNLLITLKQTKFLNQNTLLVYVNFTISIHNKLVRIIAQVIQITFQMYHINNLEHGTVHMKT